MATLYTITGLPYSGKSTLRNELVKRFGFEVISVDKIMDDNNMWRHNHPTDEDWSNAYSEAYAQLKKLLMMHKNVIFDGGSLLFEERETQRRIAKECNAAHKLVYINTPREEILERRMKNEVNRERGHLHDQEMTTALNMFEEPTKIEHPIFFNASMNLDTWIGENIN